MENKKPNLYLTSTKHVIFCLRLVANNETASKGLKEGCLEKAKDLETGKDYYTLKEFSGDLKRVSDAKHPKQVHAGLNVIGDCLVNALIDFYPGEYKH